MIFLRRLACLVAVALPLALLVKPDAAFYYDWDIHRWFIGYSGEYFHQHLRMPEVLNTSIVGMPQPVFYGYLFYPTLGLLSSFVGANLALRLGLLALVTLQFAAVYLGARTALRQRGAALVIAAVVVWSIYSLTNLYNRAALPEFFANGFMLSAIGFAAAAIAETQKPRQNFLRWMAGFCVILMVGTHPPTAVLGAGFFAMLIVVWLATRESGTDLFGPANRAFALRFVVAGLLVLGPWIYANLALHGDLGVLAKYSRILFFPLRSDSPFARFAPFPYDPLTAAKGVSGVATSTPYLEAPINFALLLLAVWNARIWLQRRPAASGVARSLSLAGLVWFALMTALSLLPPLAAFFGFLAPYVQFAYRLVSHANAGLLVAVLATGVVIARNGGYEKFQRATLLVLLVCAAIAATGLGMKLRHAAAVQHEDPSPAFQWLGNREALITAGRTDSAGDYAALGTVAPLSEEKARAASRLAFPVGARGADFGKVFGLEVELAEPTWVVTNVVAFPWSKLIADDREIAQERLARHGFFLAAELPRGKTVLRYAWEPPILWRAWNIAAQIGLGLMLVSSLGWAGGLAHRATGSAMVAAD